MPAVRKKKKATKAKSKSTRRKQTRKKSESRFSFLSELASRYATAGAAGLTVVAVLAAGIFWSGGYFGLVGEQMNRTFAGWAVGAGFKIERITAKGLDNTSEDEIISAVGPVLGGSLLHFDPYAARARVEEIGWVRSAAVSRLWPGSIHVSVREREPAAVWQISGAMHLIDDHGVVIREINAYEYSNLPLIVGSGAPGSASEILQALRAEPALWGRASALVRVGDRRWNLRLNKGGDVRFPEHGESAAVRDLAKLHDAYGLLDRPLDYIDLRDPNSLVYRERGDAETGLSLEIKEAPLEDAPAREG